MGGGGGGTNKVPESFDRAASTKRANLVRAQWNDYKQRFQPVENQIIKDMGNGPMTTYGQAGIDEAQKSVNTAFNTANAMQTRDQQRFGTELTPQQAQAQATELNMSKALASTNATNTARQWDIDRRNAVMSGGLGNAATIGRA